MSACSESQSTILPLPSSPHWEPTTATFAIKHPRTRPLAPPPRARQSANPPETQRLISPAATPPNSRFLCLLELCFDGGAARAGRQAAGIASKSQRLDALDVGDALDALDHLRWDRPVHLDQRDGVAARRFAPDVEGRNIDAGIAQRGGEAADEARLIQIRDVEHVRAELGDDPDILDSDDARSPVGKHGALDRAILPLGDHGERE